MVDAIMDPLSCPVCDQHLPSPDDGQWRWAKSGKVFDSEKTANDAVEALNSRNEKWEFRAATDAEGRVRIASRRRAS